VETVKKPAFRGASSIGVRARDCTDRSTQTSSNAGLRHNQHQSTLKAADQNCEPGQTECCPEILSLVSLMPPCTIHAR
jgi:hypothetical protein